MQQETTATKTKKTPVRRAKESVPEPTQFSIEGIYDGVRGALGDFDKHPLTFVRENPLRATFFGFLIGMILGSALSKRAVTK